MLFFTTAITLGLAAQAIAQTTTPTPEQWDAITSDLAVQFTSLRDSPALSSVIQALQPAEQQIAGNPNDPVDSVLAGNSLSSFGIPYSFLTATPTVSWGPWSTLLPASARSALEAFATSLGVEEQSLVTKDLSFTAGKTAATAASGSMMTTTTGSAGATTTGGAASGSETGTAGGAATSSPAPGSGAMGLQVGWVMGAGAGVVGVVAALL